MKNYIYIDNYRGFSNTHIPMLQVNFLVGENSTGKTSFLELLEMLCYPPFWLFEPKFGVPGHNNRHFLDLVSAASPDKKYFTIGAISISEEKSDECHGIYITYQNIDGRPQPKRVSVLSNKQFRTIDGKLWISRRSTKYKFRKTPISDDILSLNHEVKSAKYIELHNGNQRFSTHETPEELQGSPLFIRCETELFDTVNEERNIYIPTPFRTSIIELAPIRFKPKRTYDAPQTEFSPEGEHTPYVIKKRLASKSQAEKFASFLEQIGKNSGLFEKISIKSYGKSPLAPFEIKLTLGKAALGLDNVGYGVSQALPIIIEIFTRPQKTTFTIQQPEVHLHPKAQASIGDLIAELARDEKKNFFIETHSDFTIDRFRLNIRKNGELPSQLLFFERDSVGNNVTAIDITTDGSLSEDQPDSYREFFFNESLSLLG